MSCMNSASRQHVCEATLGRYLQGFECLNPDYERLHRGQVSALSPLMRFVKYEVASIYSGVSSWNAPEIFVFASILHASEVMRARLPINFGTGEINLRKSNCLVQHLQWKSPRTFRTKKKGAIRCRRCISFSCPSFWGTMVTLEHNALEFFYVYALSTWTNSQPTKNCHCRRHHYVLYLVSYWTLHAQCM